MSGRIADPEVEVDRIGLEDDAQPALSVLRSFRGSFRRAGDDRGVRGPPADVAGAFVEVAIYDVDGIESKVDQALPAHLADDGAANLRQFFEVGANLTLQGSRDDIDLRRQLLELIGHDRKALARISGPRRHNHGVHRQHFGLPIDRRDLSDLDARHGVEPGRQVEDAFRAGFGFRVGHVV